MTREFPSSKGAFFKLIQLGLLIAPLIIAGYFYIYRQEKNIVWMLWGAIILSWGVLYLLSSLKYIVEPNYFVVKLGPIPLRFSLLKLEKIYTLKGYKRSKPPPRISLNFYLDPFKILIFQFKIFSLNISPDKPETLIDTIKFRFPKIEIVE